jgi:hypothetical protein
LGELDGGQDGKSKDIIHNVRLGEPVGDDRVIEASTVTTAVNPVADNSIFDRRNTGNDLRCYKYSFTIWNRITYAIGLSNLRFNVAHDKGNVPLGNLLEVETKAGIDLVEDVRVNVFEDLIGLLFKDGTT